jgi:hypothetical protein
VGGVRLAVFCWLPADDCNGVPPGCFCKILISGELLSSTKIIKKLRRFSGGFELSEGDGFSVAGLLFTIIYKPAN